MQINIFVIQQQQQQQQDGFEINYEKNILEDGVKSLEWEWNIILIFLLSK